MKSFIKLTDQKQGEKYEVTSFEFMKTKCGQILVLF